MSALIIIEESLTYVVEAVNRFDKELDLNLTPHHYQNGVAVWSVADALIKATATREQCCEVEVVNFRRNPRGISEKARKKWDLLLGRLKKNFRHYGVLVEDQPDAERLARRTLMPIPPSEEEDHKEWKEEQERSSQLTVEEAVEKLIDEENALHGAVGDGAHGQRQKTSSSRESESGHYAYPRKKRREIVKKYREARAAGKVGNKDAWARTHYQISGRTLLNYEREFPQK